MIESQSVSAYQNLLEHKIVPLSSHLAKIIIHVNADLVYKVREQTLNLFQESVWQPGFKKNSIPFSYLEKNYHSEITKTIKSFLFTHVVLGYLQQVLFNKKILVANVPRLTTIASNNDLSISFEFDISIAQSLCLKEWKHFVFKMPKRKNYKDLDKQVALFLKREQTSLKKKNPTIIEDDDWVCFTATLVNTKEKPLLNPYINTFWIKIINRYLARPLPSMFLGKQVGDSFITNQLCLHESFEERVQKRYFYLIKIEQIAKGCHMSVDAFKANFKLKSKTDIHKKLIEIFSYRNDLSQRKSIIEELFHLFFSKHRFEVPKHIVIRKQEDIMLELKNLPDYHVYKMHKKFDQHVEMLAEKQLKEEILIDQITHDEGITINNKDIFYYLNLFNNERLQEFIYFKPLLQRIEDSASPIHPNVLHQAALREKTLNHIIYTLTR